MTEDKGMMKLVVSILKEDPSKEVKIIKLPSTITQKRKLQLRRHSTTG